MALGAFVGQHLGGLLGCDGDFVQLPVVSIYDVLLDLVVELLLYWG